MNRYFKFKKDHDYFVTIDGVLYIYFSLFYKEPYLKRKSTLPLEHILSFVGKTLIEVNEEQFLKDLIILGVNDDE